MTNKFFWVCVKTISPVLAILFVVSVLTVFSMDMWLNDIPASCQFFVALGKFNYGVAVSYIAAFVFYLITVHYPDTRASQDNYKAADFPANALVTTVENIFLDMSEKLGEKITREELTDDKIRSILSKTKCVSDSIIYRPPVRVNGNPQPLNWVEYLESRDSTLKSYEKILTPLFVKLDAEYVSTLSQFMQDDTLTNVIRMINLQSALYPPQKSNQTFGDGLEEMFLGKYH